MNNYESFYVITKNSAQCLSCKQVIESTYRHDYATCMCGKLAVDGGLDYLKRTYDDSKLVKELSVNRKMTLEELQDRLDTYLNYFDNSEWGEKRAQEVRSCALHWYQVEL
jgi:hypothetical protein